MKYAWEMERELRDNAVPLDRRSHDSHWFESGFTAPTGDDLLNLFWSSTVPGSLAPEIVYQDMVQSLENQGYDVREAAALLPEGIRLHKAGNTNELRALTARLLEALWNAPVIPDHPYHNYTKFYDWDAIHQAMPAAAQRVATAGWKTGYADQIYQGWLGQLAGGSFGTAIEGYTGEKIRQVYGDVRSYITPPDTKNDDVIYELVFLDVYERMGRNITSEAIGLEWIRQIPFGWSAEWVAIRNMQMGIFPPESGRFQNPFLDWIGVQMRAMICGMLAPAQPLEAARLATIDAVVSHSNNGICGGIFAAVITSLAFETHDLRELLRATGDFLPAGSEYTAKYQFIMETLAKADAPQRAWPLLSAHFEQYNWIHAYPNLAADAFALWYCNADFSQAMALLAQAGNDVDCNAGLVGTVLGIPFGVPDAWATPLNDTLETYIQGKERLSIRELSARTARLAEREAAKMV